VRRASVGLAANLRSLPGAQASHPRPATCPVLCYPMNADVNRPSGLTQCQARMQGDHVSGLGSKPRGARRVALKSPSGPPPGRLEIPGTAHVDGGVGMESTATSQHAALLATCRPGGDRLRRWSRYLGLGSRARCGGITACFDSPSPEHRSGLSVHAMVFHFYRFVTPGEVM